MLQASRARDIERVLEQMLAPLDRIGDQEQYLRDTIEHFKKSGTDSALRIAQLLEEVVGERLG